MRVSGPDRHTIWKLYENHVVTDETVLQEFLGKLKSPFGATGQPAANTPQPTAAPQTQAPAPSDPIAAQPGKPDQQAQQDPANNDGKLTMGDLKKTIELIQSGLKAEQLKSQAKSLGGDIFNLVTTLAPIPNVLDAIITGKDVVEGLLGVIKVVSDPRQQKAAAKAPTLQQNPIMAALQVDPELSSVMDDQIEQEFLKTELGAIMKQANSTPNAPLPDMTQIFRDFLNKDYLTKQSNVTGK
ncbi:hypothetical protein OAU81_00375 [bacterium]|nr:hypothetical protein [bacterium]